MNLKSIACYLYSNFNSRRHHKAALLKPGSSFRSLMSTLGDSGKENLPEMTREGNRHKRDPILFWVTLSSKTTVCRWRRWMMEGSGSIWAILPDAFYKSRQKSFISIFQTHVHTLYTKPLAKWHSYKVSQCSSEMWICSIWNVVTLLRIYSDLAMHMYRKTFRITGRTIWDYLMLR